MCGFLLRVNFFFFLGGGGGGGNLGIVFLLCMSAGPAKPGVCPKNNVEDAVSGVCDEMCSHDSDCPKNQKCCSNGCGHECMVPYKGIYILC